MADYFSYLCFVLNYGEGKAKHCFAAVLHFLPEYTKERFPLARRSLVSYGKLGLGKEGRGFSEEVWGLLLEHFAESNPHAFLVLAFCVDTYARGQDWESLRVEDIFIAGKQVAARFGARHRGESAKTGFEQGVVISRGWVAKLIAERWRSMSSKGTKRFFAISRKEFDVAWADALSSLGLSFVGSPHSTRHAGATIDHLSRKKPLDEVQLRGRWSARSSVARYDKPHVLVECNSRLSSALLRKGRLFLDRMGG